MIVRPWTGVHLRAIIGVTTNATKKIVSFIPLKPGALETLLRRDTAEPIWVGSEERSDDKTGCVADRTILGMSAGRWLRSPIQEYVSQKNAEHRIIKIYPSIHPVKCLT